MMISAFILAWLLPLLGFTVLVFWGRRIGEPRAGYLAAGLMLVSAAISVVCATTWITNSLSVLNSSTPWLRIGAYDVPFGVHLDSLTIVMFTMVTVVASFIFIYSVGYMHGDSRFPRFFTYMSLFAFSMLGLILSDSLFGLFVFWELVGLCSYLLIGFWYEKPSASNAAKKAFIVNRVGDFLFLLGIATILATTGSTTLSGVFDSVRHGAFAEQHGLLTFAGIALFFGAVGKSAQFPLHVWLPDAMEGPTPISALIHAATMVAAGVYMVARVFPVLTPDAMLFIAYTGAVTLIGSALIAVVMTDIKKVLAYSTISQLGFMILSLGVGGWVAGLFHLVTHACFKALLFLGSGSVIHGCHGEQDIRKMGQLHQKMPITSWTFLVGTLAISGVPLLSGFYSKDAILASVLGFSSNHPAHWALFILPAIGSGLTAFYMMRLYFLTFRTTARDHHIHSHAHESPRSMWVPLAFLAILSIGAGWFGAEPTRHALPDGTYSYEGGRGLQGMIGRAQPQWAVSYATASSHEAAPSAAAEHHGAAAVVAAQPEAAAHAEGHHFHTIATIIATLAMLVGVSTAWLVYVRGVISPARTAEIFAPVYRLLLNKFYIDELYHAMFVVPVLKLATAGTWIDRVIFDGLANGSARWAVRLATFSGRTLDQGGVDGLVNGVGNVTVAAGDIVRKGQTGRVRQYLLIMVTVAAVVVFGLFMWVR